MRNTKLVSLAAALALALAGSALAAIPPSVTIRIGGAELVGVSHYAMIQGATVSIAIEGKPGDTIMLVAKALDASGEAIDATATILMLGTTLNGQLAGDFLVPAGLAGQSFELEAHAMAPGGAVSSSTTVRVDVLRALRLSEPGLGKPIDE